MIMKEFEKFCEEYNLEYDFTKLNNITYVSNITQMAFIIFKYSGDFKYDGSNQEY